MLKKVYSDNSISGMNHFSLAKLVNKTLYSIYSHCLQVETRFIIFLYVIYSYEKFLRNIDFALYDINKFHL